jgi:hypothetical protein
MIKSLNILGELSIKTSLDRIWIVDSRASQHMISYPTIFKSYKPLLGKEKIQTVDGTFFSIAGIKNVTCTPNI